jgi:SAM-dependent methyltransferase
MLPSAELQIRTVGLQGDAALAEASRFHSFILERLTAQKPVTLDFGVGWGRIIRFFKHDTDQLIGVDVDADLLAEARKCGTGAVLQIAPLGRLPFPDKTFDLVYAFSVFSHLPRKVADHWAREISRALKANGLFVFTILGEEFLQTCIASKIDPNPSDFGRTLGAAFDDPSEALQRYRLGEFVYAPTGGGGMLESTIYGWTAIPPAYIEANWPFSIHEIDASKTVCPQIIVVAGLQAKPLSTRSEL